MEYKTVDELGKVAEVKSAHPMSQAERLERWAQLLDRRPERTLTTFFETEHQSPETRNALRSNESAITVAFEDPQLRADGLANDSYGEAKRYFDLADWELHRVVCYCHHGATMSARTAASAVRAIMYPGAIAWVRRRLAGG